MVIEIDSAAVIDTIRAALPDATPNAAALMFLAQVPHLDATEAVRVVDQIGHEFPPGAWYFDDERLDRWPAAVAASAMRHVRRLQAGWRRVLMFCELAERLTDEERLEAFEGIMDGALASATWVYNKPVSVRDQKIRLLRLMPREEQEAWIRSEYESAPPDEQLRLEVRARWNLDALPEDVVRELFARIEEAWQPGERAPPDLSLELFERLPVEQRERVLERVRSLPLAHGWRLRALAGELTDAQYREVMQPPAEPYRHCLASKEKLLPRAPYDVVVRWLDAILSLEDYDRLFEVGKLLPLLRDDDRRRAEEAVVGSISRVGHCSRKLWPLMPEVDLAPMLWALRDDPYGYFRDDLIEHIVAEREAACAERCLPPLLNVLDTFAADHRLEMVTAMTPWLATQTEGHLPAALASLPIRASGRAENQQYMIERVFQMTPALEASDPHSSPTSDDEQ